MDAMSNEHAPGGKAGAAALAANAPIVVFGGNGGNLEATEALLAAAARLGVSPKGIICAGDVVAYGAEALATVARVRDAGVHVAMGNREESLAWRREDRDFLKDGACDRLATEGYRYADAQLDADARTWMRGLPRRIDVLVGGYRLAVIRGAIDRIHVFIFALAPDEDIRRPIALAGWDAIIAGHCGLPFTRGRLWRHPGAIGVPANDGTRRTWFSLIAPLPPGRRLALDYDFAAAARKMRDAGLPEGDAAALETGLWPGCDVPPPAEQARRGQPIVETLWDWQDPAKRPVRGGDSAAPATATPATAAPARAVRAKFSDADITASGARRASVPFSGLETLWFNTGTLCNLVCHNCYIESSPRNDRLVYLSRADVRGFLAEALGSRPPPEDIGFTGGEPFMNPEILGMIEDALAAGFRVLVLTNAMKPMHRRKGPLLDLARRYGRRLTLRVSLDHYGPAGHEKLRGAKSWQPTIDGLTWLSANGFEVSVAGRTLWGESEAELRAGFRSLFAALRLAIDADDPTRLVLFPEMEASADVPEITEHCWGILGKSPRSVMCATSRMVVKRKGARRPTVVSCTLLPYDKGFEMGATLAEAARPVKLNHRHCARFCVLGGASCSPHGRSS